MNKLRIVIVEDEPVSARQLLHMLQAIDETINVMAMIATVKEAVNWFNSKPENYDLIFMDIKLADGISFDIFKKTNILQPVIFVTAYSDYAIQAFKNNGIDYILKPFDQPDVEQAIIKYKKLVSHSGKAIDSTRFEKLLEQLNQVTKSYKKSFLVHFKEKLIPVETVKVAWFYTAKEIVYARTIDNRQHIMDFTMEQMEQQLDPQLFFRANRQFIINRNSILEVGFYFNGRLLVKVNPEPSEPILISKARVPEFKRWMNT